MRTFWMFGEQIGPRASGVARSSRGASLASILSAALLLSILTGCFFGKTPVTRYYTLDYVPAPPQARLERGPYPFTVRLREATIAEAYRRSQIVYRQSAYQMQFYSYNLWAVDPERMVDDLLFKHLRAARLFENVTRVAETIPPDFQISADVRAIEEYDSPDRWYAHLAIEYQLIEEKTGQVLWKQLYDLRAPVPQQEPVFVVRELAALTSIMHDRLVEELEPVLQEAMKRRAAEPSTTRDR
jgi:cholesterol transport system auxiliary component